MNHFHHCPYCYEAWECTAGCTIEPDLEDRGRPFASHWRCPHKLVCLIEAAADRHDLQLRSYEAMKSITLRRLQKAPRVVGVSERVNDPRWDTVTLEHRPAMHHRFDEWRKALNVVEPGGVLVLLGGDHRIPSDTVGAKGVSFVAVHGASVDMRVPEPVDLKLVLNVSALRRRPRHHRHAAASKIRPYGVR